MESKLLDFYFSEKMLSNIFFLLQKNLFTTKHYRNDNEHCIIFKYIKKHYLMVMFRLCYDILLCGARFHKRTVTLL